MIEIIEHKDYNKPVDNDTVVEVTGSGNTKKKLFKVFDGIWLDPHPVDVLYANDNTSSIILPYQKDYCQTIEQKSKYLEQMTILFKRINSTDLGQGLLTELYKGSPCNLNDINNIWNTNNMLFSSSASSTINRNLRSSCILRPNSSYLENYANIIPNFKAGVIETSQSFVYFHPDCIISLKKGSVVYYFDPAVALYHELLHVCHGLYGLVATSSREEEYTTFGHLDALYYLTQKSTAYKLKLNILAKNLGIIKEKINAIKDPADKKYFQTKYNIKESTVISEKFLDEYISKYQIVQSEYNFANSLRLKANNIRTSYDENFFINFKYDISDPKIYNIKDGFINLSNTIEEIKANPSNIFGVFDVNKVTEILRECSISKRKRSANINLIPLEPLGSDIDREEALSKNKGLSNNNVAGKKKKRSKKLSRRYC